MAPTKFPTLVPDLQISFYYKLKEIRSVYLNEALRDAVSRASISEIDADLSRYVSPESLKRVATFGIRGEVVFPTPTLLTTNPFLLGYYRLLYGYSQKEFYKAPFGRFRDMEDSGIISGRIGTDIHGLSASLVKTGEILVENIDVLSASVIHELQLLTYGPLLRGSRNTSLGSAAEKEVKDAIREIFKEKTAIQETKSNIRFENSDGDAVQCIFAGDPDVSIFVSRNDVAEPLLSIEIKGGTDFSNIHNRLGEAEKSHIKAKNAGFKESWTIIAVKLAVKEAKKNTPTTDEIFYMSDMRDVNSQGFSKFRSLLLKATGF